MPNQSDVRWFVITTLASWNLVSGFGFYAYILDCFFNYPPEHEKRQFKYHTFSGRINQDIVIGITMVMFLQILSTILLCLALNGTKRKCFIYGIFISMAFPCACLPVWPLAVAHVSIALAALSYYFG
ncbi:uncharacterized protein LOC128255813 isoform X1 [Drosophila gunungcola]|uniref:Uncharacterized protein n=1 Tax=Drosophila gunungcola TaxID=103775 RepID=A0A9P9YIA0_9MUSC|nr:uncharacterized protein LOC128255813 isoform X1 [Drosophila gunungcola]KAI8037291.1 hypothetical protein M5D96_010042 [Drosophila gunungcola]